MRKRILIKVTIFIAALLIIAIGAFFVRQPATQTATIQPSETPVVDSVPTDLVIGRADAPATMVEYGDYKCPECARYNNDAGERIRKDYVETGKLKIIYKPYPVYGQDGGRALYGSYCANEQFKFTEYHDAVYEYMWQNYYQDGNYQAAIDNTLGDPVLLDIVGSIGLDKAKFTICMEQRTYADLFEKALFEAADDDVQGTPTFIINKQKIVGSQPFNIYKTLIDIQLR